MSTELEKLKSDARAVLYGDTMIQYSEANSARRVWVTDLDSLLDRAYELGRTEANTVKLSVDDGRSFAEGWNVYRGDVQLIQYYGMKGRAKGDAERIVKAVNPNAIIQWEDEDDRT